MVILGSGVVTEAIMPKESAGWRLQVEELGFCQQRNGLAKESGLIYAT